MTDVPDTNAAAARLVAALAYRGMTCSAAESCTGGLVGAAITSIPGSSAVFNGGVVSYANSVKRDVLGVPQEVLDGKGAVSPECAEAMAAGVRRLLATDIAVSVTGIAGPGGGSAEKPVGLVWFGIASADGTKTFQMIFKGEREEVRRQAVRFALGLLVSAVPSDGFQSQNDSQIKRR